MTDQNLPDEQDKDLSQPPPEAPAQPPEGNQTFKTFEDALEGYKSIQGAYTKTTQENKALRDEMERIRDQVQLMQLGGSQPQQQPQQQDFDSMYIQDPEKAIESTVDRKVAERMQHAQIATVLNDLSVESPNDFQERYAYAQMLSKQYPQLVTSPAGVRKLFQMGDQARTEDMRRNAQKSISLLFGDNVDMNRLQQLVSTQDPSQQNTSNAYMPDTTQSTGSLPEPDLEKSISEAVQQGDAEKVLEGIFKRQLK